jgi:hypothetical protein
MQATISLQSPLFTCVVLSFTHKEQCSIQSSSNFHHLFQLQAEYVQDNNVEVTEATICLCFQFLSYCQFMQLVTPYREMTVLTGSRRRIFGEARIHKYMHTRHNNNVLNIKLLQFKGSNSIHQSSCSGIINDK